MLNKRFKEADYVIEDTFGVPAVNIAQMEPLSPWFKRIFLGGLRFGPATHTLTIVVENWQNHSRLPMNQIRVISTYVGAVLGQRLFEGRTSLLCPGLEVETQASQSVSSPGRKRFPASVVRHPAIITVKSGVKKDGT
jgi:CO/xanthine dehydrogenase Mo-binding subunit